MVPKWSLVAAALIRRGLFPGYPAGCDCDCDCNCSCNCDCDWDSPPAVIPPERPIIPAFDCGNVGEGVLRMPAPAPAPTACDGWVEAAAAAAAARAGGGRRRALQSLRAAAFKKEGGERGIRLLAELGK